MTIREQVEAVREALEEWAEANRGNVFVASDVVQLIDSLRTKPGAPRCGILFWEELPRGMELLGRVDRTFKVVVSRGRGLNLVSGESLTDGAAGGKAMFDLVEEAREVLLGIVVNDEEGFELEDEERVPVYKGSGPFEVNGLLLDAYEVRFGLGAQTGGAALAKS